MQQADSLLESLPGQMRKGASIAWSHVWGLPPWAKLKCLFHFILVSSFITFQTLFKNDLFIFETIRQSPSAGSLPYGLQELGLGQAESRSLEFHQGFPLGWQELKPFSHHLFPLRSISRRWIRAEQLGLRLPPSITCNSLSNHTTTTVPSQNFSKFLEKIYSFICKAELQRERRAWRRERQRPSNYSVTPQIVAMPRFYQAKARSQQFQPSLRTWAIFCCFCSHVSRELDGK